jgi:hypothetical protein
MNEIVLHPYYKLEYIKLAWGGAEEQDKERAAGNQQAKNWQDEAKKVLETEVFDRYLGFCLANKFQMEKYWKDRPRAPPARSTLATDSDAGSIQVAAASSTGSVLSDFDRYRRTLVADGDYGWESELRRYLKDMPADVTAETNIIEWWQVCSNVYLSRTSIKIHISRPIEQLWVISHPRTHSLGRSPNPSIFRPLRAPIFCS